MGYLPYQLVSLPDFWTVLGPPKPLDPSRLGPPGCWDPHLNIIWGNELAFWGGDLPSLMSKMEYICDLGLPVIFCCVVLGLVILDGRFGGWGLGVGDGWRWRSAYGWSTCPPPFRTSLQKSGWKIAGLIKGNQGLISCDHKAGYFWGGVRFGGVGWLAIYNFIFLRTSDVWGVWGETISPRNRVENGGKLKHMRVSYWLNCIMQYIAYSMCF